MTLALILPAEYAGPLREALREMAPELDIQCWPEIHAARVPLAVAWRHPSGSLAELPGLEAVLSYGAGVDTLTADPTIPPEVALGRVVYPGLIEQMTEYLEAVVLAQHRGLWDYAAMQHARRWRPLEMPTTATIGILGLGELGEFAARRFQRRGFRVVGWSRRPREIDDVASHVGAQGLIRVAACSDYLICLVPLTPETRGILNAELFRHCKPGACLINVGRGLHLVEDDLMQALNTGQLGAACLDVFTQEPLPADHPFWTHPKIHITPHVASQTDPQAAARHILADYRRLLEGKGLQYPVDRHRGY